MPGRTAYDRAADRIARLCHIHDDERSLRAAVIEEIQSALDVDAYGWILTDPETEVGSSPLAAMPCLDELPLMIRLKYLTTVNRWTQLDAPPVTRLRVATDDQPEQSRLWRELLSAYEVIDVASMVLRDRHGCWSFIDLWRIAPSAAFSAADEDFLTGLAPQLCKAIRRCHAHTFDDTVVELPQGGPAVLVLSPELQVRVQTRETDEYLRRLLPTDADRRPIPAAAYNVAAQLLAREAGVDDHQATARVHLAGGRWVTFRAARIGDPGAIDSDIAVTIEPTSPAGRLSLFVRSFGLSDREAELIAHLAAGADTHQIAAAMHVSENTVQDHLKSIFTKTGTRNRRTLLTRLRG